MRLRPQQLLRNYPVRGQSERGRSDRERYAPNLLLVLVLVGIWMGTTFFVFHFFFPCRLFFVRETAGRPVQVKIVLITNCVVFFFFGLTVSTLNLPR